MWSAPVFFAVAAWASLFIQLVGRAAPAQRLETEEIGVSRSIGNDLPPILRPLLDGRDQAIREGVTFLLLTTTHHGWPHVAMLSVGELLYTGPRTLRAALWPSSTATRNLTRTRRATVALVHEGSGYYLRCCARRGEDLEGLSSEGRLAFFEMEIVEAMEDAVAYAKLTSGVTFQLANPGVVLPRWRETIAALRELPSPG